ncbi:MAG: type II toxin-antitoxin system RelE/ParE family toxin, partial [Pseudomonadota bacterium]
MTPRYRLTPRAANDLDDIADYTIQSWGEDQAGEHLAALVERFESLADNPMLGRNRDDMHPGYRSFPEGSHIVF